MPSVGNVWVNFQNSHRPLTDGWCCCCCVGVVVVDVVHKFVTAVNRSVPCCCSDNFYSLRERGEKKVEKIKRGNK